MSDIVTLLGTLAIILTFAGVFRFSKFFFSTGALLNLVIAFALTVVFMIFFEYIILFFGILALLSPVGILLYITDFDSSFRSVLPESADELFQSSESTSSTVECPYCGEENDSENDYCMTCRRTINDD